MPSTSPTNNSSTGLRMQNRRAVRILGVWWLDCVLQSVATHRPENGGGIQRGTVPLWHTTFGTKWKKSSVLYLLSRLARERGCTGGQPLFRARKAGRGMERQQSFLCLLSGGIKGIYSPRPSSSVPPQRHQRSSLRRRLFSAACSVFCARFTVSWKCAAVSGMGCSSPSEKP